MRASRQGDRRSAPTVT